MIYSLLFLDAPFSTKAIIFVCYMLALAVGFTLHEFAHAHTAVKCGDITPKVYGRDTINPLAHIDVSGILCFIVLGFGWAKPVPINTLNFQNHYKRKTFLVSIIGVLTNLIIAIFFIGIFNLWFRYGGYFAWGNEFFYYLFVMFIQINLVLVVFNLLPVYPLDGFNAISSYMRYENKFVVFMRKYGTIILWGLLIAMFLIDYIWNFSIITYLCYYISYPINWVWSKIFGLEPILTMFLMWGV